MGTKKLREVSRSWFLVLGSWLTAGLKKVRCSLFLALGYSVVARGPLASRRFPNVGFLHRRFETGRLAGHLL